MIDNREKYNTLRQHNPLFEYLAFHYKVEDEGMKVWFDFRMGDVEFHPTALIDRRQFLRLEPDNIDRLVFDIGMAELVSYWKCACPPRVEVQCGQLDLYELGFWKKLYWNGLGEFFFTNGLISDKSSCVSISDFMSLDCTNDAPQLAPPDSLNLCHTVDYLVPVGGGKDSVVSLELLRRAGKRVRPLIMNPRGATVMCASKAGFAMDDVLVIHRSIDPALLELNRKGYLNGHTPFSAMLAFYTRLASHLSGVPNVALSNESSANESTVAGMSVNHQYSKSREFEDDFRAYCSHLGSSDTSSVSSNFNYISFLRPLTELQIAMLFSRFDAYHEVFRSCNAGSKTDVWCGHCAKCLFAYVILSPFIEPERLDTIFGKAMLDDLSLQHELAELVGLAPTKPFECVGTVDEVRQALAMAATRWPDRRHVNLLQTLDIPTPHEWIDLSKPAGQANLTDEEYAILTQACIEKNN